MGLAVNAAGPADKAADAFRELCAKVAPTCSKPAKPNGLYFPESVSGLTAAVVAAAIDEDHWRRRIITSISIM